VTATSTVDFSDPPTLVISDGTLTETFLSGTLFGTSSGSGTASGLGTATFTIDFVITGGTGIFAGYTGEATLTGVITQTSPTTESSPVRILVRSRSPSLQPSCYSLSVSQVSSAIVCNGDGSVNLLSSVEELRLAARRAECFDGLLF